MDIKRTTQKLTIKGRFFLMEWEMSGNGELSRIYLNDSETDFILTDAETGTVPSFSIEGENWKRTLEDSQTSIFSFRRKTKTYVSFRFTDRMETPGGVINVVLDYTVYETGVLFCDINIKYANNATPTVIKKCGLGMTVPVNPFKWFRWWCFKRPELAVLEHDEAGTLMTMSVGETGLDRFKTRRDSRRIAGCLDPYIGMDFGRTERFSNHIEFFLEKWEAFGTNDRRKTGNVFVQKDGRMSCRWEILNSPATIAPGTAYSNTWGIAVSRSPQKSKAVGQRIYHWFESGKPPGIDLVDRMAKFGASVLCLHESSWPTHPARCDEVKDKPYMRRLIARCHANGIRVMFYSRLYEDGLKKNWFGEVLKRNYDGIYIDGGTPWCILEKDYRFPVKRYYRIMRMVRQIVGAHGLFISHTGPWITAVGQDLVDGYLSGEQERGHLMDDIESNLFYTSQSLSIPMIWTGAFAQYRSPRAVAFYAGIGEFPHVNLGAQLPGPLTHPKDPAFRQYIIPLWLMWKSVPMERSVLFSINNHPPVVKHSSDAFLAAVYRISQKYLLVTLGHLEENSTKQDILKLDRKKLGMKGKYDVYCLKGNDYWDFTVDLLPERTEGTIATDPVEPYGIRGYLLVQGKTPLYLQNYLKMLQSKEKHPPRYYLEFVSGKKNDADSIRHIPGGWKTMHLRFDIPSTILGRFKGYYKIKVWNAEFSMTAKTVGYLSARGIKTTLPQPPDYIDRMPGEYDSGWIEFSRFLKSGNNIVTFTCYSEMTPGSGFVPIYFVGRIRLSSDRGENVLRELTFDNELDMNSTSITFSINR
jgi:hypothetical protein